MSRAPLAHAGGRTWGASAVRSGNDVQEYGEATIGVLLLWNRALLGIQGLQGDSILTQSGSYAVDEMLFRDSATTPVRLGAVTNAIFHEYRNCCDRLMLASGSELGDSDPDLMLAYILLRGGLLTSEDVQRMIGREPPAIYANERQHLQAMGFIPRSANAMIDAVARAGPQPANTFVEAVARSRFRPSPSLPSFTSQFDRLEWFIGRNLVPRDRNGDIISEITNNPDGVVMDTNPDGFVRTPADRHTYTLNPRSVVADYIETTQSRRPLIHRNQNMPLLAQARPTPQPQLPPAPAFPDPSRPLKRRIGP